MLDVVAHRENRFPSSHGVGAHNRVDSLKNFSDIIRSSTCRREEFEIVLLGCCVEVWLGVVGRKSV